MPNTNAAIAAQPNLEQNNPEQNNQNNAENNIVHIKAVVQSAPDVKNEFAKFDLPPKLLQCLTRIGFTSPTPIQDQTIPFALDGRDILASAQTGTGKTGAFGIPLIAKLMQDPKSMALIMTPTRELATQVLAAIQTMIPVAEIKTALLIGGESMFKQFAQLDRKPRIIVGTPGRINDHLNRGSLRLHEARFVVLDETDRMLDMGFGVQIEAIMKFVPPSRQMLLYTATLPKHISNLANKYLNNPERVSAGTTSTPAAKIKQENVMTTADDKYNALLTELAKRSGSIIMFIKTKYGTEKMATRLIAQGYAADCIHGDLQQRKRDRVIQGFRDKKFRILVATDVAARGLDIPHIEHVINYDLPQCPEDYIHRIGRTARAGAEGEALNIITQADMVKWDAIQTLLTGKPPEHRASAPKKSGARKRSGGARHKFARNGEGNGQGRPENRGENRSENRSEGRSDNRPNNRNEGRPEGRSDNRFDSRPNNRNEGRNDGRNENRSDSRNDNRSENRSPVQRAPSNFNGGQNGRNEGGRNDGQNNNAGKGKVFAQKRKFTGGNPNGNAHGNSHSVNTQNAKSSRYSLGR